MLTRYESERVLNRLAEYIENGVDALYRLYPEGAELSLETLDMATPFGSGCRCIGAQIDGDYFRWRRGLPQIFQKHKSLPDSYAFDISLDEILFSLGQKIDQVTNEDHDWFLYHWTGLWVRALTGTIHDKASTNA